MRFADIDWRVLRGALALLVVAIAVSVSVVTATQMFSNKVQREFRRQRAALLSVRSAYQRVDEEKKTLELYLPRYRALKAAGVIGRERRLSWVEALRAAARRIGLPALRYEIATQKRYTPDYPLTTGDYQLYESDMKLTIGLFHEGDLLHLFRLLDTDAKGLYSVSRCSISRAGRMFSLDPRKTNLNAECVLRWFTVHKPEAG